MSEPEERKGDEDAAAHAEMHRRQKEQLRAMLRQRLGREPSDEELAQFEAAARAQAERVRQQGSVRVPSDEEAREMLRARGVAEPADEQVRMVQDQARAMQQRMATGGAGFGHVQAKLELPTEEQVRQILMQRGVPEPTGEQIQKVIEDTRVMQQRQLQMQMQRAHMIRQQQLRQQQQQQQDGGAGLGGDGDEQKQQLPPVETVLPSEDEVREMFAARGVEATDEMVRDFLAAIEESSQNDSGMPSRESLRAMLTTDGREPTERQLQQAESRIAQAIALRREGRIDADKALIGCIKRGDLASARKCVEEHGASLNAATPQGNTALMWAAWHTQEEMVDWLLEAGADATLTNQRRQSGMHWAAMGGSVPIVRRLHCAGVPIEATDEDGFTPMHAAAQFGRTLAMSYLRVHGADVEALDENQRTPLHWACYKAHVISSKWLIRNQHADIWPRDTDGRLPLHWAAAKNNVACVKALVAEGADEQLDVKDNHGQTPEEFGLGREPPSAAAVDFLQMVRRRRSGWRRVLGRLTCQLKHKDSMQRTAVTVTAWMWSMLVLTFVHGSAYMYPLNDDSEGMRNAFAVWWSFGLLAAASWLVTKFREPGYVPLPKHRSAAARAARRRAARRAAGTGDARGDQVYSSEEEDEDEDEDDGASSAADGASSSAASAAGSSSAMVARGGDGDDDDAGAAAGNDDIELEIRPADEAGAGASDEAGAGDEAPDEGITYAQALREGLADRLCPTCEIIRPPRSKHDPVSDRCVYRFDHFCPWVGNAVGERTHPPFLVFVWAIFVCLTMHVVLSFVHFARNGFQPADVALLPFLLHSLGMSLYAMTLAMQHSWFAWRNVTTNEEVNGYRYAYLRDAEGNFVNPFNEGALTNCLVFWGFRKARPFAELNLRTDPLTPEELAKVRPGAHHRGGGGGHGHSHGGRGRRPAGGHGHSHGGGGGGHSHGGGRQCQHAH